VKGERERGGGERRGGKLKALFAGPMSSGVRRRKVEGKKKGGGGREPLGKRRWDFRFDVRQTVYGGGESARKTEGEKVGMPVKREVKREGQEELHPTETWHTGLKKTIGRAGSHLLRKYTGTA